MTVTGTPGSDPQDSKPTPIAGEEALAPSFEVWIERMMRRGERMHREEDYRREIAKRLS